MDRKSTIQIKILIADEHSLIRRGARALLTEAFPEVMIGEAVNTRELFDAVRAERWDLIILDPSMPGTTGLEGLMEVKRRYPDIPVLVLTMHSEDQFAVRALKSGAAGYLTKEYASEELLNAVNMILDEGKYVSGSLAKRLDTELWEDAERPSHERLSQREYRVMCLIASGKTVTEIAEHLSLSVKTVSTYRARILGKMKMKNNAELTHHCIRNGLVD